MPSRNQTRYGKGKSLKIGILSLLIAVLIGISARAEARRNYYLVGLRHLYKFDIFPDPRTPARQEIEEQYSGAVQAAQNQFNSDMASIRSEEAQDNGNIHQNDRDAVQLNLEHDTAVAATARDNQLSQMYTQCDWVWDTHPELRVDQDGPYRVMGVETNPYGAFVNVYFYQPYPTYVGPCPYGYGWGRPYAYASFGVVVHTYHTTWVSMGSPIFFGLSFGGSAVEVYAPIRRSIIINQNTWVGGRPPAITVVQRQALTRNYTLQVQRGAIHPSPQALQNLPVRGVNRGGGSFGNGNGNGTGNGHRTNPGLTGTTGSRYSGGNRTTTTGGGSTGSFGGNRGGSGTTGTSTGGSKYGRNRGSSNREGGGSSTTGTRSFGGSRGTSSTGSTETTRTSTGSSSTSRFGQGGSSRSTGGSGSSTSTRTRSTGTSGTRTRSTGSSTRSSGGQSKYSHSGKDKKGGE